MTFSCSHYVHGSVVIFLLLAVFDDVVSLTDKVLVFSVGLF